MNSPQATGSAPATDLYSHLLSLADAGLCSPSTPGDEQQFWLVEQGHIDCFLTARNVDGAARARQHILRMDAGQLLWLPDLSQHQEYQLLLVPGLDCVYRRLPGDACLAALTKDEWNSDNLECLRSSMKLLGRMGSDHLPNGSREFLPGYLTSVQEMGLVLHPGNDDCWVALEEGRASLLAELALSVGQFLPFPGKQWLQLHPESKIRAYSTAEVAQQGQAAWLGIQRLFAYLLEYSINQIVRGNQAELERLVRKSELDQQTISGALGEFAAVMKKGRQALASGDSGDPYLDACRVIGREMGMEFKAALQYRQNGRRDAIKDIASASGGRCRLVALKGHWWTQNHGPLLALEAQTKRPLALLPHGEDAYHLVNPISGEKTLVTAEHTSNMEAFGYMFYRSLPSKALDLGELVRFVAQGVRSELWLVALIGLTSGLLSMTIPVATGHLFQNVFPAADHFQVLQIVTILFVAGFVGLLFNASRAYAMLRLESRAGGALQVAVWDRVLSLPVPFFRDYMAGDLAQRINGINDIRKALSGTFVSSLLGSLFSSLNVILLFYYSVPLALAGIGLVVFAVAVNFLIGYLQVRITRDASTLEGKVSGVVYEYLSGIAKLRTSGAEWRAFKNWAQLFASQKRMDLQIGKLNNISHVFSSTFALFCNIVIFLMIYLAFFGEGMKNFSTGDFIAFNAAFGAFLMAMLSLVRAGLDILQILPLYERTKPILQTLPESSSDKPAAAELTGAIELSNISFSYAPDAPLILDDISLSIKAGEFVALVGASGSGKSTLLRLMLGFEKPLHGGIYYDAQNIDDVDIGGLRRQLGVVLQGGQLMSGDIFTNIIGATSLVLADAWDAARACGLDKDIEGMPMGMHTLVDSGGGSLSGGQRQRLLIARAIVNKPRIIYFDEATSALDNQTQAIVSSSLEKLRATRVVIAHRLSTIINADRIYVLDRGRIVQSGTYHELMQQDGLFTELAKRQIA